MSNSIGKSAIFDASNTTALLALPIVAFISYLIHQTYRGTPGSSKFPRIGKDPHGPFALIVARRDFLRNGARLIEEGYRKHRNGVYVVQTLDMERLIIPPKYIHELRAYPSSVLNIKAAIKEKHLARWNTTESIHETNLHVDVTRVQLNQHLHELLPYLVEEAEVAWGLALSKCTERSKEWQYVPATPVVFSVIGQIVNRILVGDPICRNKEWFGLSLAYAKDAFGISASLRPWPELLRYLVFPFLESRKRLRHSIVRANQILEPEIELRRKQKGTRLDSLQWMVDTAKGEDQEVGELVKKVLFLELASIMTSSVAITHALYDLCAHPEIVEPLRDEIKAVLKQEGGWTLEGVQKMDKLDSFLKESQRLNHPGLLVFNRIVAKDIVLSDGVVLPAGSLISVPTHAMARDPDHYQDPMKFDAFRYYNRRKLDPAHSEDELFTTITPEMLPFGWGAFACPGRHFASVQMKVATAILLLNYNLKFPNGQVERPPNVYEDERVYANRTQMLGFQRRSA